MASAESTPKASFIERVFARRKPAAYVLFLVAAAFAGVSIWVGATWGRSLAPVWLWGGGMAVLALAAGLWLFLYDAPEGRGVDDLRMMVLGVGGAAGLLTVLLGLVLGYQWWNDILAWMKPGGADRTVSAKEQWQAGLRALLPMPILLLGAAIMFASLQLARTEERNKPVLRRLLYGYNAVLTCLLLLLVLAVVNVFVGVKLQKSLDFTSSTMFTLSDRSVNILRHLEQPVKIYMIMSRSGPVGNAVERMLDNCREVDNKLQFEQVPPNPGEDPQKYFELRKKYPALEEGLLIEYGPEGKQEYRLIKADDLFSQNRSDASQARFEFKGEDALMTELTALSEGGKKPTVYFLQGHGELDLKDMDRRSRTGAGELKGRLEKRNFVVNPLSLDSPNAKVPADATMVVIAGPTNLLSDNALKALDEYMGKSGKLVVLLGPTYNRQHTEMVKTGLEPLLARFNVQVGFDRVLSLPNRSLRSMTDLIATGNSQLRGNPLIEPFDKVPLIFIGGSRSIKPAQARPNMPARLRAETFLTSYSGLPVWEESNLSEDPLRLFNDYRQNNVETLERKLQTALPLAVGVVETTGPPPNPHMFMQQQQPPSEQKPRMVVIGNAIIASNLYTNAAGAEAGSEFLASSMEWLRERSGNIGIPPKKQGVYSLPATATTSFWSFILMPTVLVLFGVVGLGTGVWLVRRR